MPESEPVNAGRRELQTNRRMEAQMALLDKALGFASFIPTPWKILAVVVAFAAYSWFVFNKGVEWSDGKAARAAVEAIKEQIIEHNEQSKKDMLFAIKSLDKQESIREMFDGLKTDLERSIREKPVFMNKDCELDKADLDLWNGKDKGVKK